MGGSTRWRLDVDAVSIGSVARKGTSELDGPGDGALRRLSMMVRTETGGRHGVGGGLLLRLPFAILRKRLEDVTRRN